MLIMLGNGPLTRMVQVLVGMSMFLRPIMGVDMTMGETGVRSVRRQLILEFNYVGLGHNSYTQSIRTA